MTSLWTSLNHAKCPHKAVNVGRLRFNLLPGQRYDTTGTAPLIEGVTFDGLIAPSHGSQENHCRVTDKAFDTDAIIADLNERRAKIVISQHPRRSQPLEIDLDIYKWRHLIENFFAQTQRVQENSHAKRQARYILRRHDLRNRRRHKLQMNINRPWACLRLTESPWGIPEVFGM